jgi:hypothetical protein
MKVRRWLAAGAAVAGAATAVDLACSVLPDIQPNVCGNSIVEMDAGEQCEPIQGDANTCYRTDAGTRACHFMCSATLPCQPGWGCGADGVCRTPDPQAGAVTLVSPATPGDFVELQLADFDGDGRLDVVSRGVGATTIHFFDDSGHVAATAGPLNLVRGRATTLANGSLASLVILDAQISIGSQGYYVAGTGVAAWRGQSDRTLAPVLFTSFPIQGVADSTILAGQVHAGGLFGDDEILVFSQGPFGGKGSAGLAYVSTTAGYEPMAYIDASPDASVQDIPIVRFSQNPCDSVVIGFRGDQTATSYRACDVDGGPNVIPGDASADVSTGPFPPTTITFKKPMAGAPNKIVALDVDGDGQLDLVTGHPAGGAVQIAYGSDAGSFDASVLPIVGAGSPVLAAGFIDDDGTGPNALDVVFPGGILLTNFPAYKLPPSLTLQDAYVLDLNKDAHQDVVGVSGAGIDVWVGTGTPLMNHRLYAMPSINEARIGDVDGDSYPDIIVGTGAKNAQISVLYGTPGGFPEDPVSIGAVTDLHHISTGRFTWFFGDVPDAVSSIIITAGSSSQPNSLVVIPIQGHATRQLVSPLVLSPSASGSPENPFANPQMPLGGGVGSLLSFDASTYTQSLVALTTTPGLFDGGVLRPVNVEVTPNGEIFNAQLVQQPTGLNLPVDYNGARGVGVTTADIAPGVPGDEMVAVVPNEDATGTITVASLGKAGWTTLFQQSFTGAARRAGATTDAGTQNNATVFPVNPKHARLHDDTNEDVVIVHTTDPGTYAQSAMTVFFGDGSGKFTSSWTSPPEANIYAAAPINALGLPNQRQVAVVTDKGLEIYASTTCNGSPCMQSVKRYVGLPQLEFSGVVDMTAGDVNGDGVDDIVVATRSQLFVLLQVPAIR